MKRVKQTVLAIGLGACSLSAIHGVAFGQGGLGSAGDFGRPGGFGSPGGFGDRGHFGNRGGFGNRGDFGNRGSDRGPSDPANAANVLNALDTNGDGSVSLEEFTTVRGQWTDRRFNALDQDGDGAISESEYNASGFGRSGSLGIDQAALASCIEQRTGVAETNRRTWADLLSAADTTADGLIDQLEFTDLQNTRAAERFAAIDTNNDGALDSSELEAARTQSRERQQARAACLREQADLNRVFGF